MKVVKKTSILSAEQWFSWKSLEGVDRFSGDIFVLNTNSGQLCIFNGDWIITDNLGHRYLCRKDMLNILYNIVKEEKDCYVIGR